MKDDLQKLRLLEEEDLAPCNQSRVACISIVSTDLIHVCSIGEDLTQSACGTCGAGWISVQVCSVNTALAAIAGVLTFKELLDVLVSVP